jgi:hypothetical protein
MDKGDVSTYNEDGVWKSKIEGSSRAAHAGGTKAIGQKMARNRGVEHTIRNLDGASDSAQRFTGARPPRRRA